MSPEQAALLARSGRVLRSARLLLESGDLPSAINRAYYAAFYAASAALRGRGEAPKTHHGVLQRFHLHFVKTDLVEPATAAAFKAALDARAYADYEALAEFEPEQTAALLADAERFVAAVRTLVEDEPVP